MRASHSSAAKMRLIGGRVCLDFVNTVGGRNALVLGDKLGDYSNLVKWSRHADIITGTEARRLIQEGKQSPIEAETVFRRALALREALYRICKAIIAGRAPRSGDLETVNDELLVARSHERLTHAEDRFTWEWVGGEVALDRMLWSIAHSGGELLTTGDLSRLRACGGEECGWLFEDTSRNRSRQWCHMQECGNLAKVRRFRIRLRRASKG
jgi:predicted RNA-binding Zn ribbon-like protein